MPDMSETPLLYALNDSTGVTGDSLTIDGMLLKVVKTNCTLPHSGMPISGIFDLTLYDNTSKEIVTVESYATGVTYYEYTLSNRGSQSTTAKAWPSDSKVVLNVTANQINGLNIYADSANTSIVNLESAFNINANSHQYTIERVTSGSDIYRTVDNTVDGIVSISDDVRYQSISISSQYNSDFTDYFDSTMGFKIKTGSEPGGIVFAGSMSGDAATEDWRIFNRNSGLYIITDRSGDNDIYIGNAFLFKGINPIPTNLTVLGNMTSFHSIITGGTDSTAVLLLGGNENIESAFGIKAFITDTTTATDIYRFLLLTDTVGAFQTLTLTGVNSDESSIAPCLAFIYSDSTTIMSVPSNELNCTSERVIFTNLPTSDPTVAGQLWNDSGTLKISAG